MKNTARERANERWGIQKPEVDSRQTHSSETSGSETTHRVFGPKGSWIGGYASDFKTVEKTEQRSETPAQGYFRKYPCPGCGQLKCADDSKGECYIYSDRC